ncbi:Quinone oxidoreductase 1 [bacterium HR30]|nr:Quinone oxidoreductase 1 [bacterium HR30]
MYAMVVHQPGESEQLRRIDLPDPEPSPGRVVLEVKAVGCNFSDLLMVQGKYQLKPPLPFSPGSEVAGVVRAVGDDVNHVQPGQRVMAMLDWGGYASMVAAPSEFVVPLPDFMPDEVGAAFGVAYQTAYLALAQRAALQAGEILLVHGAAGGVGLAAVEVGRALGARVLATAGSAEKCDVALRHGAEVCFPVESERWVEQVREATNGRGVDVVYDPIGGKIFDQSLRCLAWCGRLVVIGFASGEIPSLAVNRVLLKNVSVVGLNLGAYKRQDPAALVRSLQELFRLYGSGALRPEISYRLRLDQANEALALIRERKTVGKVILLP